MSNVAGGTFIGLLFLIWIAVLILPMIFFILTQQRALSKCSPRNQTMSPGLVWLQIIPVFGFIWQFFVVFALANSLGNEFRSRGIQEEDKPGQGIGLAMCITRVCVIIPILGLLSLIASVVLWIVYWVKIAGFSRALDYAPNSGYQTPSYGPGYYGSQPVGGSPYPGGGLQPPAYPPATPAVAAASAAAIMPPAAVPAAIPPADAQPVTPADGATPADTTSVDTTFCATCGASLSADAASCARCGTKVE